jgi:Putative auto-transporter adhesin, head GIN domain
MKQLVIVLACMFSLMAFAQTKQTRSIGDFSGISSATGIEVEITQGSENAVVVSASKDEFIDRMKTEVDKNGVLKIYMVNKNGMGWNNRYNVKLYAYVTYKSINKLMASSGSSLEAKNTIKAEALSIDVSSGASVEADIETKDCEVIMSSGSDTRVKGTATNIRMDASSGSSFKGADLSTETCRATVSSGADIKIGVSKKLSASASSGGSVKYKGDPEVERKAESSGGSIRKM